MRLYIATSNPGKLRDFAHAARAFPHVEILPLPGLNEIPAPDETADTFLGNATIKALAYGALLPHEIVLADDSGIVVPALNGKPGVRSARYADDEGFKQPGTTDARNLNCLLANTAHLHQPPAHYTAVLAAARQGQILATAEGRVDGTLLAAPRGTGGFGYDPIFHLPELNLTMAEIDPATRLRVSHRGRALVSLLSILDPSLTVIAQSER
jgi:XTP/dITP diphosphohydrolase